MDRILSQRNQDDRTWEKLAALCTRFLAHYTSVRAAGPICWKQMPASGISEEKMTEQLIGKFNKYQLTRKGKSFLSVMLSDT